MTTYNTYADILRPSDNRRALGYDLGLVVGGSLFIALLAQLSLNIGPVPITGQTLGVLLIGALFGSKRGALTVLAYLAQGAMGLPVFAGGTAGPAVLVGPTAGYLVGFVFAAFVVGLLAERGWDRHALTTALAMLIGNLVIYTVGVAWLSTLIGLEAAIANGVVPFLLGDLLKIALATALLPLGWKLINE
ncbi:MAG: biotin transporter BioY [Anaerolineales bacterium]|nr:biotin transporter BioY [Anaerolineales bacterium]